MNKPNEKLFSEALRAYKSGAPQHAIGLLQQLIETEPENADAWHNCGAILSGLGQQNEALEYLKKAVELEGENALFLSSLGSLLEGLGQTQEACQYLAKAIEIDADFMPAYLRLAKLYQDMGSYEQAEGLAVKALQLEPQSSETWMRYATILDLQKRYRESMRAYKNAYAFNNNNHEAFIYYVRACRYICNWSNLEALEEKVNQLVASELISHRPLSEDPWSFTVRNMDVAMTQAVARRYAQQREQRVSQTGIRFNHQPEAKEKLKIAYISGQFYNHPSMHLMVDLFKRHDRNQFEVHLFSYGKNDGSYYRQRAEQDADVFHEVKDLDFIAIAQKIYEAGIDILIDQRGHTLGNKQEIYALRPAPVQVTYLGYPATTGADYIDYLVVDPTVVPEEHRQYYTESLAYMPHTYQISSGNVLPPQDEMTREKCGLPEDKIIYCSFNTAYKIEPVIFGIWMSILKAVPESIMWLLENDDETTRNLRVAAEQAGVSSDRLIFAPKMSKPDHFARTKLADIFLDTYICNAHTTTADAIWAGVPVITCLGEHFASRVAGSIVKAAGMDELVVDTLDQYQQLAIELGQTPARLQQVKDKLQSCAAPLFKPEDYVKAWESLLQKMWQARLNGERPKILT